MASPSDLSIRLGAQHGVDPDEVHAVLHEDDDIDAHFAGLAALVEDFLYPEENPPLVPDSTRVYAAPFSEEEPRPDYSADLPWARQRYLRDFAAWRARADLVRNCPACDGSGEVTIPSRGYYDPPELDECQACKGTGKLSQADWEMVSGWIREREEDLILGSDHGYAGEDF